VLCEQIELLDCGVPKLVRAVVCGIVDEGGAGQGLADALRGQTRSLVIKMLNL
jgi:hypothetical protein